MLTIILIILYTSGFVLMFLTLLLLDDERTTFLNSMIKLAGIIFWPFVLIWYLLESAGVFRKFSKSASPDAPVEHDSWL
ncbi:hypothetical protein [Salmonirosea aquatica]|uniref:Uncharacterized protein n=1 Tax=Salmonirosea aquatica TaxID=2654236 RepID=A0A7C9G000_9BACT|nr:hypothetical protein [Cytophagaceae bacterium SJW1-29]